MLCARRYSGKDKVGLDFPSISKIMRARKVIRLGSLGSSKELCLYEVPPVITIQHFHPEGPNIRFTSFHCNVCITAACSTVFVPPPIMQSSTKEHKVRNLILGRRFIIRSEIA